MESRSRRSGFNWGSIRQYDLFPKVDSDVVVKSKAGGCVTIVALCCILLLFLSETYYFFEVQRMDTIIVDTSRPVPFPITFDIIFPFMECSIANVDLVDDDDRPIPVYSHDVKKHRINPRGEDINEAKARASRRNADDNVRVDPTIVKPIEEQQKQQPGAGYGGITDLCSPCATRVFSFNPELCCDCNSAIAYYTKRGNPELATSHPACIREHTAEYIKSLGDKGLPINTEGCRIKGTVVVPRARANFHIAAGFKSNQRRTHQVDSNRIEELNNKFKVQHVIRHLRFGDEFEGQAAPLEGYELYTPGLLRHIYLIKLVPTRYEGGWLTVDSYQYTFAPHTEKVDTSAKHWHLPGVYFRYDFTPMMALVSTRYSHLSTYITRLFALMGGLWVVLGIIYRLSNKVAHTVNAKKTQ